MTDTILIWKAINLIIPNSHPVLYQYIQGQSKSKMSAILRITDITYSIFGGIYNIIKIRKIAQEFLKMKVNKWEKGEIKLKPIYET